MAKRSMPKQNCTKKNARDRVWVARCKSLRDATDDYLEELDVHVEGWLKAIRKAKMNRLRIQVLETMDE